LAEDIRKRGNSSLFYRFSAGRFALRIRARDPLFDPRYTSEYLAPIRRKQISHAAALVIDKADIVPSGKNCVDPNLDWLLSIFRDGRYSYIEREIAERRFDITQVVTYVAICQPGRVLAHVRGSFASAAAEFLGELSIGFGGHVEYCDASLFDVTGVGLYENAIRELREELRISSADLRRDLAKGAFRMVGTLSDDTTKSGLNHLAVAFVLRVPEGFGIEKGELSINNLDWIPLGRGSNYLSRMEAWSKYLFRYLTDALA
jgi:predicted NUDIX family phosphoesterase